MMSAASAYDVTPPLSILDLIPEDVLGSILSESHGIIPPTTLLELACTCKAAAAVTLPHLYSNVLIPSLPALAQFSAAVATRPDLAVHVRSLTLSQYFAGVGQFTLVADALGEMSKGNPVSAIDSVDEVQKRCGPALSNAFPMAWLIRIARICPNLKSVDLSRIPDLGPVTQCLTLGFLDLARVLRQRGGRLVSSNKAPISAVAVKGIGPGGGASDKLYLVTAMDWAKKQLDVCSLAPGTKPNHLSLVPFSDVTSTTLEQQQQWTVRNASLASTAYRFPLPIPGLEWFCFGIGGAGRDHVFDLSDPNQLDETAQVSLETTHIGKCHSILDRYQPDLAQRCSQVHWTAKGPQEIYEAPRSQDPELCELIGRATTALAQFTLCPWLAMSRLVVTSAFFLTHDNVSPTLQAMADALPNLTSLELLDLYVPMDLVLTRLDCLVRRRPNRGTLLQSLRLSAFCFTTNNQVMSLPSSSCSERVIHDNVTDLDLGKRNWRHLHTLKLEVSGPGADNLAHHQCPTVAVHPGIMYGLECLLLKSVKLVLVPPHFAQASSASFLPISTITNHVNPMQRVVLPLEHVTLPNLKHLDVTTHSLAPLTTTGPRSTNPPYRVPDALPYAPNLEHLCLVSADATQALVAKHVLPTLFLFPKLVFAHFASTSLQANDVQDVVRAVLAPPKPFAPCPQLRNLVVDNVLVKIRAGRLNVRGQLVSMPHLTHLVDQGKVPGLDPIAFSPTSVEQGGRALYHGPDVPETITCPSCGLLVPKPPSPALFEDELDALNNAGWMGMAGIMKYTRAWKQVNSGQKPPATLCPRCGPQDRVHVWYDRVKTWKEGKVAVGELPSLWCREVPLSD